MRTMKSDTAILRHAQFWDRQKKGYITPIDAVTGMMRLGYSTLSSIFFGSFLGVIIAYAMQDAWLMFDPRCRIYIERLIHIKRRRGDSMYDIDGRLNVQVFEGLYDKYARHDMSGCSMTLSEAMHMASEHGSFGLSPSEWTRATIKWLLFYLIASKGGVFEKADIQAIYDGSLFYKMHEAHQQSRQSRAEQVFVPSKAWVRQPLTQPWVPVVQKSTVVLTGVKVPSDDTSIEFETQLSCFVRAPEASLGKREALSLSGLRRAVRFDDTISEARYDEDKPASILDIVVPEPPGGNSAEPAVDTDASGLFDGLLRLENDNAVAHQLCPVNEDTLSVTTGVVLEPVILSGLVPTDATTEFNGYVAKPDQHIGRTEVPEEALKHWLTNGLLHGVLQHSPTTPCYEAPPSEDVFTDDPILPYLKEEASEMPLRAFTCKGSNEPLTNWLDTPAIAGTYRKTTTYAYVQAPALRDMFAESEDRVVTAADPAQIFKDLLRDSKRLSGVAVNDDDDCTQAAANDRRTEADSHGATIDEAKKDSFYKTESEAVRQDHSAASQDSDIPNDVDRDPEFSQIAVAEFSRVDGEKMANEQDDEYDDDDERSLSTPSDTVTGDSSPELVQQNHQEHQAESGKVMLNDEDWPLLISLAAQREE